MDYCTLEFGEKKSPQRNYSRRLLNYIGYAITIVVTPIAALIAAESVVCAASIAVVVTLSVSDVLFDIVTSSASEKVAAAPLVAVNLNTLPVKPFANDVPSM